VKELKDASKTNQLQSDDQIHIICALSRMSGTLLVSKGARYVLYESGADH
jgi:hypothetical protein